MRNWRITRTKSGSFVLEFQGEAYSVTGCVGDTVTFVEGLSERELEQLQAHINQFLFETQIQKVVGANYGRD